MTLRRVATLASSALGALTLLAAGSCGGKPAAPTEVHARLSEYRIELDRSSVPAGPVEFTLTNVGKIKHEFLVELPGAVNQPLEAGGRTARVPSVDPGQTVRLAWTFDQEGQYQLACHIAGHYEAGMFTTLNVSG